jgi:cellulose synthase/poly-beta-1,6-N-acetylglucosamine synthase-like glycosyltransferase
VVLPKLLEWVLFGLGLPVTASATYLFGLALTSWRVSPPSPPSPRLRFDLVVPAHNESSGIGATVESLVKVDYPEGLRRVVVIADNCSDDTAERARAAGATVWERQNKELRGKGYALNWAFEKILAEGKTDAVSVIDADTLVSPGLLHAFAARLEAGEVAVQAHYGVRNPEASWRTRLMRIALAMFHQVRSTGRERMKLSCGLRGNGMCFRTSLLKEVPHEAFSIVEDLEYGVRLGRAGHRVAYAGEADVFGEMVAGESASRSQRQRWEGGRRQLARSLGWPLLKEALNKRSLLLFDLAIDVLLPPLSRIAVPVGLGLSASVVLLSLTGAGSAALGLYCWALVGLGAYATAGWLHSGTGARGLVDLMFVPAYLVWKVTLAFQRPVAKKPDEWVRTTREGGPPP